MATETFSFPGNNYSKDAIVSALRFSFKNVPDMPDYKYDEDESVSKIQIYKEFPRRLFKPPTIVVRAGSSTFDLTSLGDDEVLTDKIYDQNVQYVRTWGKMTVPISIIINTLTTTDREKLTDLTAFFFRHLFRTKFAELGLSYNKISTTGEGQFEWDNQIVYTNTVQIPIYQEYTSDLPVSIIELIKSFQITVILDP